MKNWAEELNKNFSMEEVQMTKKHEEMLNIPHHIRFQLVRKGLK
jgi:hypothetical protein